MGLPKIWAHRGASMEAPENTLEAFSLAVKQKADGVELDIHLTKDEQIVVAHDEILSRVSNGFGFIKDHTLRELKELNFNCNHPHYEMCHIPTLEEVLTLLKDTPLEINIELKSGIILYKDLEKKVVELVHNMQFENRVIYSSFHHVSLLALRALDTTAKLGLLYSDGWVHIQEYAKALGVNALHPALYNVQEEGFFEKCKENNLEVNVWTVNTKEQLLLAKEYPFHAIITDKPAFAREVLFGKHKF